MDCGGTARTIRKRRLLFGEQACWLAKERELTQSQFRKAFPTTTRNGDPASELPGTHSEPCTRRFSERRMASITRKPRRFSSRRSEARETRHCSARRFSDVRQVKIHPSARSLISVASPICSRRHYLLELAIFAPRPGVAHRRPTWIRRFETRRSKT